jgi:hypothetical protein
MKRNLHTFILVVVLVFAVPLLLGGVAPSSQGKKSVDSLKAKLSETGFVVQDGELATFNSLSLCCAQGSTIKCMYNNVEAPYLCSTSVPLGPGESAMQLLPNNFHLGQNEALILVGKTPPPVAYFSYTVFLGTRRTTRFPLKNGNFSMMNAYVADSINNLTVHTSGPPKNPYNRELLLFIVADEQVKARVQEAARRAGYPPSMFNTIVLSPAILHLGVDPNADTFWLVQRNALPSDPQALNKYLEGKQTLLRVTLQDPAWQPDPIPVPEIAIRGTGKTEMDLMPAVDALGEAIKSYYSNGHATEQPVDWYYWEGYTGVNEEINEMGPSSDAVGPRTEGSFFLPSGKGNFAIVYGVNHEATNKATYASLTLYEDNLWIGLGVAFANDFPGSVAGYLEGLPPDNPAVQNADKLYAWKVAWDCEGDAHCLTIQNPGCANLQLSDSSPFKILFRLYLEPGTKTGPEIREILFDRVLVFQP